MFKILLMNDFNFLVFQISHSFLQPTTFISTTLYRNAYRKALRYIKYVE
jgi:hypothetical protein